MVLFCGLDFSVASPSLKKFLPTPMIIHQSSINLRYYFSALNSTAIVLQLRITWKRSLILLMVIISLWTFT